MMAHISSQGQHSIDSGAYISLLSSDVDFALHTARVDSVFGRMGWYEPSMFGEHLPTVQGCEFNHVT